VRCTEGISYGLFPILEEGLDPEALGAIPEERPAQNSATQPGQRHTGRCTNGAPRAPRARPLGAAPGWRRSQLAGARPRAIGSPGRKRGGGGGWGGE